MRIATIDKELCKSEKCAQECVSVCPRNRAGDKCVYLVDKFARIDEKICIGCALCVKKCPFKAIQVVNTPEMLKESPVHRFLPNGFTLFRLQFPIKGEVVGLLGSNGVGKSTALKILSGDLKVNLGTEKEVSIKELEKIFRGTELQKYLDELEKGKVKTIIKPQNIDILSGMKGTLETLLSKYNEKGNKDDIIEKLQLKNCIKRKLSQLSGGELQRAAIAIVAMRKADIKYIDEPTSFLDVFQRLNTAKLIRELKDESSILVVEHDLATLDFIADKVHVLYGVPGAYGIVSKPYSTRTGINTFLEGYIKEDNVRIRPEPINFGFTKKGETAEEEILAEWPDISTKLGTFSVKIKAGNIKKGEILGIFGANALGKTTFAKILTGELKTDAKLNKIEISYKPQYITLKFKGTVIELLEKEVDNPHSEEFKSEITEPLKIEMLMEKKVSQLSGGELQRVSIALALSKKVPLYLFDEPSAFLDSEQRLEVAKIIRKFCETNECSAMIIDHDLLFLSYFSDRAMLFTGESGKKGTAEQKELQKGFNEFLKILDITFRKDKTGRISANKPSSVRNTYNHN